MQQVATYEAVARACELLVKDGQKVTGRAVLGITGGSLGTVLGYIKEWRQGVNQSRKAFPTEIPAELQTSILRALEQAQAEAAAKLKEEIEQATAREMEAVDGLRLAESRIEDLLTELAKVQKLAERDRHEAEKFQAVSTAKVQALSQRIQELEAESRQLLGATEASRMEATKALLKVEMADQAISKAESQAKELGVQLSEAIKDKVSAERHAAVAAQKNQDQAEMLAETRATITEQKQEIQKIRDMNTSLEKKIAELTAGKSRA